MLSKVEILQHLYVCSVFVFKSFTRAAPEENNFTVQVGRLKGHVFRSLHALFCISVH